MVERAQHAAGVAARHRRLLLGLKGTMSEAELHVLRPGEPVGIVVVRRPDPARWDLARLSKQSGDDDQKLAEEGLADWAAALDREDRR